MTGSTLTSGELGIWDSGEVRLTHDELSGRVLWADDTTPGTTDHATHVSGTLIASGVDADAIGMSYAAPLRAFDYDDDLVEMATEAAAGMLVSNHSYGVTCGWGLTTSNGFRWYGDLTISSDEDYKFEYYSSEQADLDALARDAPHYMIVQAAGNDRNDDVEQGLPHQHWESGSWVTSNDQHDPDGGNNGYDCLSPSSCAKNNLVIGAVDDLASGYTGAGDVTITSFSSWGPTDDGRIKPDVVANGFDLYSCLATGDSDYDLKEGTSQAAANVTGSVALLIELYRDTHVLPFSPLSSTIKAVIIHTADEAGNFDGPDYEFGWGLMNTHSAAQIIDADGAGNLPLVVQNRYIIQGSLSEAESDTFVVMVSDEWPLKATLAWTDVAGTPVAAALDDPTPMLVNDLDLRVEREDGSGTFYPWVLDPDHPNQAASTGTNHLDNVEQVYVVSPTTGEHLVIVSHSGSLQDAPQYYSLVLSHPTRITLTLIPPGLLPYPVRPMFHAFATARMMGWIDVDNDGDEDQVTGPIGDSIVISRTVGNGLFTNFTPAALRDITAIVGGAWADIDNDGDADFYLARSFQPNRLFRNDGNGQFTDITAGALGDAGDTRSVVWGDYDNDGRVDLYVCNFGQPNKLLRNLGNGAFADVTAGPLGDAGPTTAAAWADYDNDGKLDLYISNLNAPNRLLRNLGNGSFTDVTSPVLGDLGPGYGVAWGDFDNDGRLDLYLANADPAPSRLFHNLGDGSFANVATTLLANPGNARSASWADYDNDGRLDLYVTITGGPNRLFHNDGDGAFSDSGQSVADPYDAVGAAWGDFDVDGWVDLAVADVSPEGPNVLYRNQGSPSGHWLQVRLVGSQSNRSAIGARVRVVTPSGAQLRQVAAGEGFLSQNSLIAAFGLSPHPAAQTVQVVWPTGTVQTFTGVAANQRILVMEPNLTGVPDHGGTSPVGISLTAGPNPFQERTRLEFQLSESGPVTLEIFDVEGRRVRRLANGRFAAGGYGFHWDGRDNDGHALGTGVYYVSLRTALGERGTSIVLMR